MARARHLGQLWSYLCLGHDVMLLGYKAAGNSPLGSIFQPAPRIGRGIDLYASWYTPCGLFMRPGLTLAAFGITTNGMAYKETHVDKLRDELFKVEKRQFDDLLLHNKLVAQLDWISDGESPFLREQRRWNTSPPPIPST